MNKQIIKKLTRKMLCIFLLLTISLNCNAQIQRTFFGCTFGCTKQSAIQKMKTLGYNIHNTDEGFTVEHKLSHNVKFGGYTWNFADFKFYKNSLYNIIFCKSSNTEQAKKLVAINYKELKNKLSKKYLSYDKDDWGQAGISWTDSKTGVICRHLFVNNQGESFYQDSYDRYSNLYLWYYDKKTTKNIVNQENNEL